MMPLMNIWQLSFNACADACMKAVPRTSKKQVGGRIAGWSEYVNPYTGNRGGGKLPPALFSLNF